MKKLNIALLFGGNSKEHDVSLISATHVYKALDKDKYNVYKIGITRDGYFKYHSGNIETLKDDNWQNYIDENAMIDILPKDSDGMKIILNNESVKIDVVLPIIHGPNCEDGSMQGFLQTAKCKYAGCNVLSSAITMDKILCKKVFDSIGLKQTKYFWALKNEYYKNKDEIIVKIEEKLKYPIFVKPSNMGSSVGISKCESKEELINGLDLAFDFDYRVVLEEGLDIREIEIGILGNDDLKVSVPGEILPGASFYDYEDKYIKSNSKTQIPADITKNQEEIIKQMAVKAFKIMDCKGMARLDFFIDKVTGEVYINEINTIPGFTPISMYPKLFINSGIEYSKLLDELIYLALNR
ncbi:MAG: D-alanine--D-alanine ligase [Peptostreptococcaceae bacterium]|nr:D-alanine--D-alanine ligase [Peptostreptococcaceae bacterium]